MTAERPEIAGTRPWSPLRIVRLVLGIVGFGFAVAAIRATWSEIGWDAGLAMGRLLAATLLAAVTTATAARAWSAILPPQDRRQHRRIYYKALIGKYIPGGVFQAAGQISLASETGIGMARAASSYVVSIVMSISAALIASFGIALVAGLAVPFRVLAILGLIAGVALGFSNMMSSAAEWIGRVLRRPVATDAIPEQRRVLEAVAWNVLGLFALGLAFAVVLHGLVPDAGLAKAVVVFPACWLVGFLAIPFPAGIGVREGALVLLLGSGGGTAATLAASLATRLAVIIAEVILFGIAQFRRTGVQ